MIHWWWLIPAVTFGSLVGFCLAALFVAAKDGDQDV